MEIKSPICIIALLFCQEKTRPKNTNCSPISSACGIKVWLNIHPLVNSIATRTPHYHNKSMCPCVRAEQVKNINKKIENLIRKKQYVEYKTTLGLHPLPINFELNVILLI